MKKSCLSAHYIRILCSLETTNRALRESAVMFWIMKYHYKTVAIKRHRSSRMYVPASKCKYFAQRVNNQDWNRGGIKAHYPDLDKRQGSYNTNIW